jgi:CRP-like cAMP-binding protein
VLALTSERVTFQAGEALILAGEQGDAAYLVVSGEVVVGMESGGEDGRAVLPAGTLVGELAMLIETEHGSTVTAAGSVNTLKFSRQMMHELMQRYPGMAEHFTAKLRDRLEQLADALREIDEMLEVEIAEASAAERQVMH